MCEIADEVDGLRVDGGFHADDHEVRLVVLVKDGCFGAVASSGVRGVGADESQFVVVVEFEAGDGTSREKSLVRGGSVEWILPVRTEDVLQVDGANEALLIPVHTGRSWGKEDVISEETDVGV